MLKKYIRDESGNIESSMVLVPLLFLFLCCIQIVSAIYIRNSDQSDVQNQASTLAISGNYSVSDSIQNIPSSSGFDDQQLLVVSESRDIPLIIPGLSNLLSRRFQSTVTGIAVIESHR